MVPNYQSKVDQSKFVIHKSTISLVLFILSQENNGKLWSYKLCKKRQIIYMTLFFYLSSLLSGSINLHHYLFGFLRPHHTCFRHITYINKTKIKFIHTSKKKS
jgi:hypothetical protein